METNHGGSMVNVIEEMVLLLNGLMDPNFGLLMEKNLQKRSLTVKFKTNLQKLCFAMELLNGELKQELATEKTALPVNGLMDQNSGGLTGCFIERTVLHTLE